MKGYKQLVKVFRKDNYAVFPVIISNKSANHPDSGCLKVVSGVGFEDGRWHYIDHYENLNTWDNVFEYYLKEIEVLGQLVNAETDEERKVIYRSINNSAVEIKGLDEFDFLEVTDEGLKSKIEIKAIDDDSPRWKKEHWTPILAAWEHSLSKLLELKKSNQLAEL